MSPVVFILALVFLFTTSASAASSVLGIDFGTLNLKAVLVKPGIPLEIVLTKDSKRKETAAVAFKPQIGPKNSIIPSELGTFPERVYGGDALALQGRLPGEVYPNLKTVLGLPWSETAHGSVQVYKERYPAIQAVQVREMGTTMFQSAAFQKAEMPWSVEELLAMELVSIKRNADSMAGKGNSVEDVVISVPTFYTADERRAIERAADLAGFYVNALITDGLAVGLDYAKSRTFPEVTKGEKPEVHVVYDMGAGSTTATVLRFQGRSVKDVGRFNKTVQEVAVLGTGWDRTLGGDSLNHVILDDYLYKFLTKPVMKSRGTQLDEIKKNGRLMARLWKDAEKSRQVLSANTETSSSFEELLPDIDFRTKLSRTQFEDLASSFADRVAGPIEDALAAAKLSMGDVDSIIMHGGAVRTPFVQRKLEALAGGSGKLRSNVNADESAVFGAAFKGAGLSPSFKVKEIRDSDIANYAAGMTYTDAGKERRQQLFGATSPVGHGASTKQITFKDKEDFSFGLFQVINDVDRPVTRVQTENLTASVKELSSQFGCEKDDISTRFSVRLSAVHGLPEVVIGTVSCEVEGAVKSGSVGDSVKDFFGFGKKKDQEPMDGDELTDGPTEEVEAEPATTSSKSSSASKSATSATSKVPEKPKKRTESISLAFTISAGGNPQPAPEEIKRMRDRLAAFDQSDKNRMAREEALNVLEGYTYTVRDFLSNTDYSSVSTDAQRNAISELLDSTRSFMESTGDVAKATDAVLRQKLTALKKLVEPIQQRRKEDLARPEKVAALRTSLDQTQKLVDMVKEQVEQASTASSKASELEASKSAEAASSNTVADSDSTATDDFDGLDEPSASSSTSTTDAPKYSSPADFSPYTDVDLTDVREAYESVNAWLAEKEAAQGELKPYEEPVLLVKDVEAKASELSKVMTDLVYKKMKVPPKPSSSKKAKTSKTKSGKKGKGTSSASTTEAPSAGGTPAAKPKFVTIGEGDEMPSEEEILRMVSEAQGDSQTARDEL